jgi:hypothetical protein
VVRVHPGVLKNSANMIAGLCVQKRRELTQDVRSDPPNLKSNFQIRAQLSHTKRLR